jgi:hypothetical protein
VLSLGTEVHNSRETTQQVHSTGWSVFAAYDSRQLPRRDDGPHLTVAVAAVAVYRYAVTGEVAGAFDNGLLQTAFDGRTRLG